MSNLQLPNPAQQSDVIAALEQAIAAVPITAPTVVASALVPAATTYTYTVVTKVNGEVSPGSITITNGAAVLSATAPNVLSWSGAPVTSPNPLYDVYRTAGGTTQGKIASNLSALSLVDTGLAGDGTTPPPFNTSGTSAQGILEPVQTVSASGAVSIVTGKVFITDAAAAALTLAAPIAGSPFAGGHDGAVLNIYSTTAFAHTITAPVNTINGNKHIVTFAAAVGSFISLTAFNGVWWGSANTGATLS